MNLDLYNYNVPEHLIAGAPSVPRDASKLMIFDTKTQKIHLDFMQNIAKYLPQNAFFIFNDTKVFPARIELESPISNKKIEFLIMQFDDHILKASANKKIKVGAQFFLGKNIQITAEQTHEKIFIFTHNSCKKNIENFLKKNGKTPLPHYIKTKLKEKDLRTKYQSIFADKIGSVAAPTASLHFTKQLLKKLEKNGHEFLHITLHVGLGTFAPILPENIAENKLHAEEFFIEKNEFEKFKNLKKQNKFALAVGTTAMRTMEHAITKNQCTGSTQLFIHSNYNFNAIDGLLTNFHLPKSSLMMLVQAFLNFKKANKTLVQLYEIAMKNDFRFYSFGDAMLII